MFITRSKAINIILTTNINNITGNAKIAGMMDDIDMTEGQYNWALSIFFIGYVS